MRNKILSLLLTTALTQNSLLISNIKSNNELTNLSSNNNFNQTSNDFTDKSLYKNFYGALDNYSNWITNQSSISGDYYSYNLDYYGDKPLTDSTLAKTAFIVDNSGNLIINPKKPLTIEDKIKLNNYQDEIKKTLSVIKINDEKKQSYKKNSSSIIDNKYFIGKNDGWNYIQLGGAQSIIDLSATPNGKLVDHCKEMSEPWGLYYIAKAKWEKHFEENVAIELIDYFLEKSTLNGILSKQWMHNILKILLENNQIFNYIRDLPYKVNTKNCALNFVTDKKNNLIELSSKLNDSSIKVRTDCHYFGNIGRELDKLSSEDMTILKWSDYAYNWNSFTVLYPSLKISNYNLKPLLELWGISQLSDWKNSSKESLLINSKDISCESEKEKTVTLSISSPDKACL